MDAASLAAQDQTNNGYDVDAWFNMTLEPMTKVWQGLGGYSQFFLSEHDAREATGAYDGTKPYRFAETLWRMAQVEPSATHGYRDEIAEYVVDIVTEAAVGVCLANIALGGGTIYQYFIPNWKGRLLETGRTFRFRHKSY